MQQPRDVVDCSSWPGIPEMYKGRSVFITGGSGFMGKVLVEKLLYSCPDIAKIYLLLRPKRGLSEEARITEMMKLPVFERVRAERPGAAAKVVAIPGDLCSEDLGISPQNIKLLQQEVSIVFHSAATLKLEAPLKDAIIQNTAGTAKMLKLAKGMKKLDAFLHLSTAFCHPDTLVLGEEVYEPDYEPEDLMKSVTWMNDEMLAELEKKVLAPSHPNTYTFSKKLAETLVKRSEKDIPVAICRPSIVCPALNEPKPGWVDSLNGPVGILVAAGKGVLRSMHCNPEYHAEVIPVDIAINALISASWRRTYQENKQELEVFNITVGKLSPITWDEVIVRGKKHFHAQPFEGAVWFPDGDIRKHKYHHLLIVYLFHWIPAILIDCLLFIFGQKRFMIRLQKRITFGLELLQYFTTREWVFLNDNFSAMNWQMNPADRWTFFQDCRNIDQDNYLKSIILGARVYCMKEDPSTLPAARRHVKRLWWVQQIFWTVIYLYFAYWVLSFNEGAKNGVDSALASIKQSIVSNIPYIGSAATKATATH